MEVNMTNALILNGNRHCLITHNCKNGADRWEFPGGKREKGESLEDCTKRENRDELGIEIQLIEIVGDYATDTPEGKFYCRTYLAKVVEGVPRIQEPDKMDRFEYASYGRLLELRDEGTLVPNLVEMLPKLAKIVAV